jgi:uncharacterized protein YjbI with pentapeptide repeats
VSRASIWVLSIFLLAYVVGAGWVIYYFPATLVDESLDPSAQGATPLTVAQRTAAITAARQALLLAAGGVLAVLTLALTQSRDAVTRARHEIDRDANRTTRYTEAVKQLGDDKAAVRFGGIYALGRIGEDSDRDRRTIVQVLQAYIAEAAPYVPREPQRQRRRFVPRFRAARQVEPSVSGPRSAEALQASTAKAAAEVLGRLSRLLVGDGLRIDLQGTSLRGANLEKASMSHALFSRADLSVVDFCDATLDKAVLSRANLSHARFRGVHAQAANFVRVRAHKTDFSRAHLQGADLNTAWFKDCDFTSANLKDAVLADAQLDGSSFTDANLQGADLRGATTTGTSFVGADLRGAGYDSKLLDTTGAKVGSLPGTASRRFFMRPWL